MIRPCRKAVAGGSTSEQRRPPENSQTYDHELVLWVSKQSQCNDTACARKRTKRTQAVKEVAWITIPMMRTVQSIMMAFLRPSRSARLGTVIVRLGNTRLTDTGDSRSSDEGAEQSTDGKHTDDETRPDVGEGASVDDARGRAAGEAQLEVVLLQGIVRSDRSAKHPARFPLVRTHHDEEVGDLTCARTMKGSVRLGQYGWC